MAEIKYKYAYDENGRLVSIYDYTKETSKLHTYYCVGCGHSMLPRAIGSKSRRAHFYHKNLVECSGETYIHKLAKKLIKQKFDNSEQFIVAYSVSKNCSNKECRLRNVRCYKRNERTEIDLKEYYDTCSMEAGVNGFTADLLLTNSKNSELPPILIEICVTHACEEKKLNSGLRIIEITVKEEQDVISIVEQKVLEESEYIFKKVVNFVSFKREFEEPMSSEVSRYIFNPSVIENGYITPIKCQQANNKLLNDSVCELNIVQIKQTTDGENRIALTWMSRNKNLRRCNLCKFYYATMYEEMYEKEPICRLSKKYGKPMYPNMIDAETCTSYHTIDRSFTSEPDTDSFLVEEVTSILPQDKDTFRVIIAGSRSFENKTLFEQTCNYYLGQKINSHKIIIMDGTSTQTSYLIKEYAKQHSLIIEPHNANWGKYGQNTAVFRSNNEMISIADALIAFWDGKSKPTGHLIESARKKGIKVVTVKY